MTCNGSLEAMIFILFFSDYQRVVHKVKGQTGCDSCARICTSIAKRKKLYIRRISRALTIQQGAQTSLTSAKGGMNSRRQEKSGYGFQSGKCHSFSIAALTVCVLTYRISRGSRAPAKVRFEISGPNQFAAIKCRLAEGLEFQCGEG